jgi:hypothetical protein
LNSHFFAPHPFFKAQAYCSQRFAAQPLWRL